MDCMGLLSSVNTPYAAVTASILFYNIMADACFRISLTCNSSVSTLDINKAREQLLVSTLSYEVYL